MLDAGRYSLEIDEELADFALWPDAQLRAPGTWEVALARQTSSDEGFAAGRTWASLVASGRLPEAYESAAALGQGIAREDRALTDDLFEPLVDVENPARSVLAALRFAETRVHQGLHSQAWDALPWIDDTSILESLPMRLQLAVGVRTATLLLCSGEVAKAKSFLKLEEPLAARWPTTFRASLGMISAQVSLMGGLIESGLSELRQAMAELEFGDPEGILPLGRALEEYIAALLGETRPKYLLSIPSPRAASVVSPPSLHIMSEALTSAAALARAGSTGEETLYALAAQARHLGLHALALQVQQLMFRHAADVYFPELTVVADTESVPVSPTAIECYRLARLEGDPRRVIEVARQAANASDLLLAADALTYAIRLSEDAGDLRGAALTRGELRGLLGRTNELGIPLYSAACVVADLTAREREIVSLAVSGSSNRGIATKLFLSQRTVEGHLYRVYAKLGIATRKELKEMSAPLLETTI